MQVDVAVIGAGTAGLSAFRAARKHGAQALLIESGPYGTTCARVGCMPSKLLISAADAAHAVRQAPHFGIRPAGPPEVDTRAVMARVRQERDRFVSFVQRDTEAIDPDQRLRGHARFVDDTTLEVEGAPTGNGAVEAVRVKARTVVIATGSRNFVPPSVAAVADRLLDNASLFELEELPRSLAVLGTGVIALELGQALSRLGVQVTFYSPYADMGPMRDPDIVREVHEVLGQELALELDCPALAFAPDASGDVLVRWQRPGALGQWQERRVERVLVAAGRRPDLEGLGLENTSIPLGPHGLPLGHNPGTAQLGELPIFLAGDASNYLPVLHEAADEGYIAGTNAARYPLVVPQARRERLAIVFTHPQMAVVGVPFARLEPESFETGEVSFGNQGRARVMGQNEGSVHIYAARTDGQLLGAEMFGPGVEHLAHLLAWAIQQRLTAAAALRMPFYHPVLEEGLRTALRDVQSRVEAHQPAYHAPAPARPS